MITEYPGMLVELAYIAGIVWILWMGGGLAHKFVSTVIVSVKILQAF